MPDLFIPGDPVAKARPRVATVGGRAHAYTPRRTAAAEQLIRAAWQSAGLPCLDVPCWVTVVARLRRPKDHLGAGGGVRPGATALLPGKPDVDNYAKTALDALNGVAYRDDALVIQLIARKVYADPPQNAGWRISVEPW